MKTLQFTIAIVLGLFSLSTFAQNETDVLRFSQSFTGGTARVIGMGGAFGALGGDMTSLSINPAGIGVYRASEFTFTPAIGADATKSTYLDHSYTDSKLKFNINNIGYVYTFNTNKEEGWVSTSFGVAYNRLNDFNKSVTITAVNPYSSLLDGYTSTLNQDNIGNTDLSNINYYKYYEALAQKTEAIWYDTNSSRYISDFDVVNQHNQRQTRAIMTNGGIGEYAISFGANYSHKLYVGATLGIDNVNYKEVKTHSETGLPTGSELTDFTFTDYFRTWGSGYNLKLGLIYRPIDVLRLGFAFHTPTYYFLSSEFHTAMDANYRNFAPANERTDVLNFDYNITTPLKIVPSIAFQFGKVGVLSVDYEYLDYSLAKIDSNDDPFTDVNTTVQNSYKATGNLKIGGEIKIGDFALRGGYGFYGSPYRSSQLNKDASTTSYSLGMGYRGKSFFFDFGYIYFNTKSVYSLYTYQQSNQTSFTETSDLNSNYGKYVMTFGFRF